MATIELNIGAKRGASTVDHIGYWNGTDADLSAEYLQVQDITTALRAVLGNAPTIRIRTEQCPEEGFVAVIRIEGYDRGIHNWRVRGDVLCGLLGQQAIPFVYRFEARPPTVTGMHLHPKEPPAHDAPWRTFNPEYFKEF